MANTVFDITEEQQMLADSVGRVFSAERDRRETVSNLAELGLLTATFPESRNGAGLGLEDITPMLEQIGNQAATVPFFGALLAGLALGRLPDSGALDIDMSAIADGRRAVCFAVCRQGAGRLSATSTGYVLDAELPLTLDANDQGILVVTLPDQGSGEQLCVVDLRAAGVGVKPFDLVDGRPCADLKLTGVALAEGAVAQLPEGSCTHLSDMAAVALSAEALGALETIRDMTREYLTAREQFGVALSSHQVLRHALVDIFHDVEQLRSLVHLASTCCAGDDVVMRQRAVSSLKRMLGIRVRRSVAQAVQMHGGVGVTEDYALGRFVKRVVVAEMMFGTSDDHAERLIGLLADSLSSVPAGAAAEATQ